MQKNAPSCLQSSVGITPRGRIQNWSKFVDEIFLSSVFMIMFVIIDTFGMTGYNTVLVSTFRSECVEHSGILSGLLVKLQSE